MSYPRVIHKKMTCRMIPFYRTQTNVDDDRTCNKRYFSWNIGVRTILKLPRKTQFITNLDEINLTYRIKHAFKVPSF